MFIGVRRGTVVCIVKHQLILSTTIIHSFYRFRFPSNSHTSRKTSCIANRTTHLLINGAYTTSLMMIWESGKLIVHNRYTYWLTYIALCDKEVTISATKKDFSTSGFARCHIRWTLRSYHLTATQYFLKRNIWILRIHFQYICI